MVEPNATSRTVWGLFTVSLAIFSVIEEHQEARAHLTHSAQ